jgi:hypothetical protein
MRWIILVSFEIKASDPTVLVISSGRQIGKGLLIYLLTIDRGITVYIAVGLRIVLVNDRQVIACRNRSCLFNDIQRCEDSRY